MVNDFIKNKNNKQNIPHHLSFIQNILGGSHGIIIFKEQLLEIVHQLTGYSYEKSSEFIQNIGNTNYFDRIDFFNNAVKRGFPEDKLNLYIKTFKNMKVIPAVKLMHLHMD